MNDGIGKALESLRTAIDAQTPEQKAKAERAARFDEMRRVENPRLHPAKDDIARDWVRRAYG